MSIDCLRAIAILWVMLYHFSSLPFFSKGTYGVLLFFIISGYCIGFSVATSKTAWHFYAKRLGRLLPAMVVCAFITTLFKYLAPALVEPERQMNWLSFFYLPFGMPTLNILQRHYMLPDGAYWSLVVEFQFYVFCFLMMAIGLKDRLIPVLCAVIVFRTLSTPPDYPTSNDFFAFFLAGMGAAAIAGGRTREGIGGIVAALLLELYHLSIGVRQPSAPLEFYRFVMLVAGTALVYAAGRYDGLTPRALRYLAFIGVISYPLYLIHQDAGNMLLQWAQIGNSSGDLVIRSIMLPAFLIFVAWMIHVVVEKNTIRRSTAFLANPFGWIVQRRAASAPPNYQLARERAASPQRPTG